MTASPTIPKEPVLGVTITPFLYTLIKAPTVAPVPQIPLSLKDALGGGVEQVTATVTGLQFAIDSDSPDAVAVAVMISPPVNTGEIPVSVQALPLVVVDPIRVPFL